MKEKEKLINLSISIITIPLSSMKFCSWRTGDKSFRVKEKSIRKLFLSSQFNFPCVATVCVFAFSRSINTVN